MRTEPHAYNTLSINISIYESTFFPFFFISLYSEFRRKQMTTINKYICHGIWINSWKCELKARSNRTRTFCTQKCWYGIHLITFIWWNVVRIFEMFGLFWHDNGGAQWNKCLLVLHRLRWIRWYGLISKVIRPHALSANDTNLTHSLTFSLYYFNFRQHFLLSLSHPVKFKLISILKCVTLNLHLNSDYHMCTQFRTIWESRKQFNKVISKVLAFWRFCFCAVCQ